MLILSRHEGEGLTIGEGIRIVVLGHDHRGVRLGIEAPANVRILRDELVAAVLEENQRAAVPSRAWLAVVPPPAPRAWRDASPGTGALGAPGAQKAWLEVVPLSATPKVSPLIGSA